MRRFLPIAAGWVARAAIIICTFINTRLLMVLIGIDNYAVFAIIQSLGPWLALLNFGIPNTVQNLIAKRRAKGGTSLHFQKIVVDISLTFGLLSFTVALPIAIVIDYFLLLGHGNVSLLSVVVLIWALISLGLTSVFTQVLHAQYRSNWPLIAPAIQAMLTTLFLMTIEFLGINTEQAGYLLVALAIAAPALLVFIFFGLLVRAKMTWHLDMRILSSLLHKSKGFMLFGLIGTLTLSSDYVIMSRIINSSEITQYNLVSKVFGALLILHGVILATSWTSLSDLYYSGKYNGMRQLVRRLLVTGMFLIILFGIPLIFCMNNIAGILSNGVVQSIPWELTLGWLIYIAMRIWADTFSTALLSANQTKIINLYLPFQAIISILCQFGFGSLFGASGVILGVISSFILTALWILPLRFIALVPRR